MADQTGEVHQTIANFYQIPYISLKDSLWPSMRSKTGLFHGMTDNDLKDYYWPVDHNHMSLWAHHALVDAIAYMMEYEGSDAR